MNIKTCIVIVGAAVTLAGCATVTRGTTTEFKVASEPSGAEVETSAGFHCAATPCSLKLPRKNEFDVTVSKKGYVTKTTHIRSVTAGGGTAGMAGNIVLGGLVGMAVDGSNGSMKDLTPNPLKVTLEPEPAAAAAAASEPAVNQTPATPASTPADADAKPAAAS